MNKVVMCLALVACAAVLANAKVMHGGKAPAGWKSVGRADKDTQMQVVFALEKQNREVLDQLFADVSNPHSIQYGNYATREQIADIINLPKEVTERIATFIANAGFECEDRGHNFKCQTTVGDVERLFNTELSTFEHEDWPFAIHRTSSYTLPAPLASFVTYVDGVADWPPMRRGRVHAKSPKAPKASEIDGCVTPLYLQDLYSVPSGYTVDQSGVSQAVLEFALLGADLGEGLSTFWDMTGVPASGDVEVVGTDVGGTGGEQTLDIDYITGVTAGADNWYWSETAFTSFYTWATDLESTDDAPLVNSVSWGQANEDGGSSITEADSEFEVLGTMGFSLFFASGDLGAPGTDSCDGVLTPEWPGTSPYGISVGATMTSGGGGDSSSSDACSDSACSDVGGCATGTTEEVCAYPGSGITSGGGFSNIEAQPSWQADAVSDYLSSGADLPSSSLYDGSMRGYPDISAHGNLYWIYLNGQGALVDGTSASTPTVSAIASYINNGLFAEGLSPLGFWNPALYAAYASGSQYFQDVTSGDNAATESDTCTSPFLGYEAVAGWDASTGLGTPNAANLLSYSTSQMLAAKNERIRLGLE